MDYYIRLRGQKQGPFTADQLQKLAIRGRFSRHYEVSTDGHTWQRGELHPELFPTPPPPRPQPVPVETHVEPPAETPPANQAQSNPTSTLPPEAAPSEEWHYTHNGAELGPLDGAELKRLIGLGQLAGDDHVWIDGMEYWQRVRDVPELARRLAPVNVTVAASPVQSSTAPPLVSGLAITSFVLGLLGASVVPCLGSILAVVFGHLALSQIRQSNGKYGGGGLAITGLILGYLVIIPVVILAIVYVAIVLLVPPGAKLGHAGVLPVYWG